MAGPLQSFSSVARLPADGDNAAIATRRLEAGTAVALASGPVVLSHTILEGHRFAVAPIAPGEALRSWGFPFGVALVAIAPGDALANASTLAALAHRQLDGARLPAAANFRDPDGQYAFDARAVVSAPAVERLTVARTFRGYRREGRRGVGTRNFIVILGTSSRTASFARQLTARLQPLARLAPGVDGIVAVAHTEGGGPDAPHNRREILRALAGFMVHPNVAAVLAVDAGTEPVGNAHLREFMRREAYPLTDVTHRFMTLAGGLAASLAEGEKTVRSWLQEAAACVRTDEPLAGLKVALQCGGSDAFSGVSGNPLAGAMVHELIRHGGSGVLTETDESIGGEAYLLRNVRDPATARAFLGKIDGFRERLSWHGVTAESNPSGGNKLRGLYNIALKSLGAVHKKDPRTRLDAVIDYGEPLPGPGFTFMNGPGNDLEGIAGQVASGCNLIVFVTGNGSITNFPFVPTLKITTTTRRHELLIHEMDINAGRYLDGEAMPALAAEAFDRLVDTASGQRTKGEHAGHAQVSLWRDWRQTDASNLAALQHRPKPDGHPLVAAPRQPERAGLSSPRFATERIGLVLPTSLCAGQIARLAAERLTARRVGAAAGIDRFVALAHTEGCGFGGAAMHDLLHRTYRGYLTHPNVAAALLLEHGCEKIPNDVMRHELAECGITAERFGWASVQLDGGIERTLDRIEAWFTERLQGPNGKQEESAPRLGDLTIAVLAQSTPSAPSSAALTGLIHDVVADGGSVLIPESDPLLADDAFRRRLLGAVPLRPTLAYGEPEGEPGLHVVATESRHWVENLTALAGCGAHLALGLVAAASEPGHVFMPVIQAAERPGVSDVDLVLSGDVARDHVTLRDWVLAVAGGTATPLTTAQGLVDFQLSRGELGVTL